MKDLSAILASPFFFFPFSDTFVLEVVVFVFSLRGLCFVTLRVYGILLDLFENMEDGEHTDTIYRLEISREIGFGVVFLLRLSTVFA